MNEPVYEYDPPAYEPGHKRYFSKEGTCTSSIRLADGSYVSCDFINEHGGPHSHRDPRPYDYLELEINWRYPRCLDRRYHARCIREVGHHGPHWMELP